MRIAIVGAGNVGTAFAILLRKAGHDIVGITSRSETSAAKAGIRLGVEYGTEPATFSRHAEVVFLTTPDRNIANVCDAIASAGGFVSGSIVAHTSGAYSSAILKEASLYGAMPISFHPLQTFANIEAGIKNLPGSFITVEGQEEALPAARQLIRDLACHPLEITTAEKPLYHAAACIVCNYFVTLMEYGLQVMEAAGVDRKEGLPALYPLIEATLNNIKHEGTVQSLTGPIARGDNDTVKSHLDAISEKIPQAEVLYRLLGLATVEIATVKGTLREDSRFELLKILEMSTDEK